MIAKPEYLIESIFSKLKNLKEKKIHLEKDELREFVKYLIKSI